MQIDFEPVEQMERMEEKVEKKRKEIEGKEEDNNKKIYI